MERKLVIAATLPLLAQQKGQYVPGQYGLNEGVLPDPGFTYANFEINYDTNTINNSSGTAVSPKPRLNLKGTSASLFTDWEVHGQRQGTNGTYKTPGQAFTDEWGLGQALPLRKDMSKLIQLGVIGYDQWQVTDNGGNVSTTLPNGTVVIAPASLLPRYSVHAVGQISSCRQKTSSYTSSTSTSTRPMRTRSVTPSSLAAPGR